MKIPHGAAPIEPDRIRPRYLGYGELVKVAHDAGFRGNALVTACSIAIEESSLNAYQVGDVSLTTAKWGPSIGLWQVRSLVAEYGTGRSRDGKALFDPAFNARSAYSISRGGRSFQPWTMYNNGRYRKWLTQMRVAVATEYPNEPGGLNLNLPGSSFTGAGSNGPGTSAFAGPIFSPALPDTAGVPLRISGKLVAGELGQRFLGGTLDFSTDEASQLTTTFLDDAYTLAQRYQLGEGSVIDFSGIRWQVDQVSVDHQDATPATTLRSLAVGVKAMRRQTPGQRAAISPTTYMQAIAKACGLGFFGEKSAKVPDITPQTVRDNTTVDPLKALVPWLKAEQLPATETAWEVGQRLAGELGFVMFETGRTLYFASPEYLFQRLPHLGITVDGSRDSLRTWITPVSRPKVAVTATSWTRKKDGTRVPYQRDLQYDVDLPREALGHIRLAQGVAFAGMGAYSSSSSRSTVMTRMSIDLTDPTAPVAISTTTNDLFKQAASTSGPVRSDAATTATGKTSSTARRAVDFVTLCLRQKGDRYIFGAEASLTDPDPDAFDCSELVQWAAAQVGVTIPDGSANQLAWCRRKGTTISVATAARTRGALLFRPGHVAVSLGDGRHTIEARGRAYGVVEYVIGNRFTSAARIPTMRY